MRMIGYAFLAILLMSGCVRRVRHIPIEPAAQAHTTHRSTVPKPTTKPKPTGRLYDTSRAESKYNLKPEPYSIHSNEQDPELLGPQTTIEAAPPVEVTKIESSTVPASPAPAAVTQKAESSPQPQVAVAAPVTSQPTVTPTPNLASSMSRGECISMIGNAKFERYSKRFGGESGAIKRCAILKKLKRG